MKAREARKIARDAHARVKRAEELSCCGITFSGKLARKLHEREHNKARKNRVYDE